MADAHGLTHLVPIASTDGPGSFYLPPRLVMSWLAFGMAVSVVLTGAFPETWPVLAIGAVSGALSATAMSWHGILLSESARLASVGRAGSVTGGVLSFGQMGAILCPSVFSVLLRVTGGYAAAWAVCALPAVLEQIPEKVYRLLHRRGWV